MSRQFPDSLLKSCRTSGGKLLTLRGSSGMVPRVGPGLARLRRHLPPWDPQQATYIVCLHFLIYKTRTTVNSAIFPAPLGRWHELIHAKHWDWQRVPRRHWVCVCSLFTVYRKQLTESALSLLLRTRNHVLPLREKSWGQSVSLMEPSMAVTFTAEQLQECPPLLYQHLAIQKLTLFNICTGLHVI